MRQVERHAEHRRIGLEERDVRGVHLRGERAGGEGRQRLDANCGQLRELRCGRGRGEANDDRRDPLALEPLALDVRERRLAGSRAEPKQSAHLGVDRGVPRTRRRTGRRCLRGSS